MKYLSLYPFIIFVFINLYKTESPHSKTVNNKLIFKTTLIDSTQYTTKDSTIIKLNNTFMSKSYLDIPWNGTPFGISIPSWYIFLPFSDTVKIEIKKLNSIKSNIIPIPKSQFLFKGLYKLTIDSILINESGIYYVKTKFCDSAFSRKLILLK
jgi:hypothetical protein